MPHHNTVGLHSQATKSALPLALLSYITETPMPETPTLQGCILSCPWRATPAC